MINALEIPTEGTVYVNGKTYTSKDKKSQIEVRQTVWHGISKL